MSVNQELKEIIAKIKFRKKINQAQISSSLGIKPTYLSDMINGRVPFSDSLRALLFEHYSDCILQSEDGKSEFNSSTISISDGTRQVRYFPNLEATGGNMQLFEDYLEESVSLSIPRHFDADFALPLAGDSMVPLYHPGCIILVKRWLERFIEYGKVYLIVTKQGNRMVKYLRPAEREDEVLCTSENSAYEPFTIPREDILALYMVKGCIFQHSM